MIRELFTWKERQTFGIWADCQPVMEESFGGVASFAAMSSIG
jgi:hypothetical protein